jgi:hypothetical protein
MIRGQNRRLGGNFPERVAPLPPNRFCLLENRVLIGFLARRLGGNRRESYCTLVTRGQSDTLSTPSGLFSDCGSLRRYDMNVREDEELRCATD